MESEERVEAYDNARGRMDMLEAAYQSMRYKFSDQTQDDVKIIISFLKSQF